MSAYMPLRQRTAVPGKQAIPHRAIALGLDERLIASCLNRYLESPDDAAITAAHTDAPYKESMRIRKAAMKAVIELDHSEKWAAAVKYPSRTDLPIFLLPGSQCFFYAAAGKKNRKGRRSASTPHNWHGPAVVIGTEWGHGTTKGILLDTL